MKFLWVFKSQWQILCKGLFTWLQGIWKAKQKERHWSNLDIRSHRKLLSKLCWKYPRMMCRASKTEKFMLLRKGQTTQGRRKGRCAFYFSLHYLSVAHWCLLLTESSWSSLTSEHGSPVSRSSAHIKQQGRMW